MRRSACTTLALGVVLFGVVMLGGVRADAADPCSMLTTSQAAAALGVPETKASGGANRCIWTSKTHKPGQGDTVTIILMDEKGFSAQRARLDVKPVTGVGDAAVQSARVPVLTAKKGNVYFSVSVHGLPPDQAMAAEQSLAKQVTP